MKRYLAIVGAVAVVAMSVVSSASAALSAPTVNTDPLAQGIFDALTANLAGILTAAGLLAGVFFILRMAKRWFGARSAA
jgi:hypothetical protein